MAVALGFEPRVAYHHTAFRVLHLRPLGHATSASQITRNPSTNATSAAIWRLTVAKNTLPGARRQDRLRPRRRTPFGSRFSPGDAGGTVVSGPFGVFLVDDEREAGGSAAAAAECDVTRGERPS